MTEAELRLLMVAVKRGLALILAAVDSWLKRHPARHKDSQS